MADIVPDTALEGKPPGADLRIGYAKTLGTQRERVFYGQCDVPGSEAELSASSVGECRQVTNMSYFMHSPVLMTCLFPKGDLGFMRSYERKQLSEMIKGLYALYRESMAKFLEQDYEAALAGLGNCQETAIRIGERIEESEGMGTAAVRYLEQYCESLYRVGARMAGKSGKREERCPEELLGRAEKALNGMPVKKEMVFLPYKASMWDSLESIWRAAAEDPEWDVYVIPIPYYDRNSDGTWGEMHYEGKDYPGEVPITPYDTYDIRARHPDVIFIHNPYDGGNSVTDIPPEYYSSDLKGNTELLCYVPYFITMGGIGKHMCLLPACLHADKIFLESERVKKIYVESFAEVRAGLGEYFRRKSEVLGSPKIDKIFGLGQSGGGREGIPQEKKIILFNSSISGLLKNPEGWLMKLHRVIRIFQTKQEAVLWWRPHPLIEATINAMHPGLYKKYREIVDEFMESNIGIYDDSMDMYRAIAVSDGYYGDRSSVVQLYGLTGKPILLEDILPENALSKDILPENALPKDILLGNALPKDNLPEAALSEDGMWEDGTAKMLEKKIYAVNGKKSVKIHEFLLQEKDVPLRYFISFVASRPGGKGYEERKRKQAQCYENSMVCNKGHTGERIFEYVKKCLEEG